MNEEERFELLEWAKAYAGCHVAARTTTSKLARINAIAIAALEYGDAYHTRDAHCCANDHDNCTAREALDKLEALLGGPRVL